MGLDLALGGLVLLMGVRGWFKGFVLQAVRWAGLITCVYAADPVRDLVKPRVVGYLPTLQPEVVDRLLWWSSAVVSYIVMVGLAKLAVKMYRRKPLGEPEPIRHDQFAGFLLGVAKGLLMAAFVAAFVQYALAHLQPIPWAVRQTESSRALAWNERYQPVARIWEMPPVQHWVGHIQRRGLPVPAERPPAEPVAAANRPPQLTVPAGSDLDWNDPTLKPDVAEAIESIRAEIRKLDQATKN